MIKDIIPFFSISNHFEFVILPLFPYNYLFHLVSLSFYFITIQSYLFATNTYQNQKKRERQLTFAPISNHFGCYIPLLGLIQASSLALFYIFLISILLFLYFFRKCVVSCVSSSAHLTA